MDDPKLISSVVCYVSKLRPIERYIFSCVMTVLIFSLKSSFFVWSISSSKTDDALFQEQILFKFLKKNRLIIIFPRILITLFKNEKQCLAVNWLTDNITSRQLLSHCQSHWPKTVYKKRTGSCYNLILNVIIINVNIRQYLCMIQYTNKITKAI